MLRLSLVLHVLTMRGMCKGCQTCCVAHEPLDLHVNATTILVKLSQSLHSPAGLSCKDPPHDMARMVFDCVSTLQNALHCNLHRQSSDQESRVLFLYTKECLLDLSAVRRTASRSGLLSIRCCAGRWCQSCWADCLVSTSVTSKSRTLTGRLRKS